MGYNASPGAVTATRQKTADIPFCIKYVYASKRGSEPEAVCLERDVAGFKMVKI